MKRFLFSLIGTLLIFCMMDEQGDAQHGRRRSRSKPTVATNSHPVEISDAPSPEENLRIADECSLPDRPRPEAAIEMSMLCGKAISLPKPTYPEMAREARVSGTVTVDVVIDEKGRVIWANAMSGHPLLQGAAVKAACHARYTPTKISERAIKVNSMINYNFVSQ